VVVTFEPLEGAKKWISETGSKLEVFVDAERKMYDFFGLSRSIYKVFHTDVLRYYGESMAQQVDVPQPSSSHGQSDFLQMGGDFTLNAGGNVVFCYPSQHASDRPEINDILRAAAAANRLT